jgi:bifunctional DNA-binding transcriptional regulator/antitoxin component of YhaV-PrlF toxin-antitoxin module
MNAKTVQRSEDLYVQFNEAEMSSLGIKPGDKFSWEIESDSSITLKKFGSIDIDISEWSREILEMLITESLEKDLPVNDIIVNILEEQLKLND